jgi:hypothetical protein
LNNFVLDKLIMKLRGKVNTPMKDKKSNKK